jgi:hypothetical protein
MVSEVMAFCPPVCAIARCAWWSTRTRPWRGELHRLIWSPCETAIWTRGPQESPNPLCLLRIARPSCLLRRPCSRPFVTIRGITSATVDRSMPVLSTRSVWEDPIVLAAVNKKANCRGVRPVPPISLMKRSSARCDTRCKRWIKTSSRDALVGLRVRDRPTGRAANAADIAYRHQGQIRKAFAGESGWKSLSFGSNA